MSTTLEASLTLFGLESLIPDWSEALGFAGIVAFEAVTSAVDHDGQSYHVVAFEGEEAIDELYHFALDIVVPGHVDLEKEALGCEARFDLKYGDHSRPIHGIVTGVQVVEGVHHDGEDAIVYRVEIGPRAHLLTLRRDSKAYQGVTAQHVIEEILRPYLIPVQFQLRTELPERPYICQVDETDFDFVRRIAADHGMFIVFEQPASFAEAAIDRGMEAAMSVITTGRVDGGSLATLASGKPREVMVFADHAAYPTLSFDGGHLSARRLAARAAGALVNLGSQELGGALHGMGAAGAIAQESLTEMADMGLHALDHAPELHFQLASGAGHHAERVVTELTRRTHLSPEKATLREYDPSRPLATHDHHAEAHHEGVEGFVHKVTELVEQARHGGGGHGGGEHGGGDHGGGGHGEEGHGEGHEGEHGDSSDDDSHGEKYEHRPLEVFEHAGHQLHPAWDYDGHRPHRTLRRERAHHDVAHAKSPCPWIAAGHRFSLEGHPVGRLDATYAVVHVHHHASRHEHELHYENHFECADAHHAHLGNFPRPTVSTVMTGTVVGAGDVHTETMGQVKVRFHWDRARGRGPSTCWLRVMQPWAGSGWGMQFLPRVGTEVVIGFESGNPDRPMVLGGVYHAAQPWPFALPASSTKSGIRTRSIPHGESGNELSFEDESERELVYLHATRDLQIETRHDRQVSVGHEDRLHVTGGRHVSIDGDSEAVTEGSHAISARGGYALSVRGQRQVSVEGTSQLAVDGTHHHRVTGLDRIDVGGRRQVSVEGDAIYRVAGNQVSVVGTSDAPRTFATHVEGESRLAASHRVEITAEQEIVLRVGSTTLRLGPDQAELSSATVIVRGADARALFADGACKVLAKDTMQVKADTILLKSSGAGLGLSAEAAVEGSKILLNSPQNADDSVEDESRELTKIELTDDMGEPIAHQPYRIVLADGREIAGMVDQDGKAELELEEGGDIYFPGLHSVEEA